MSFEAITAVAQSIAAIGVVAGLFFVGVQIQHNTRAVRAATFHRITDIFNAVNLTIGGSTEVARVLRAGFGGMSNLTPDEVVQFSFLALSSLRVMETLSYEVKTGVVDVELWKTEQQTIGHLMDNPGMREWWRENVISIRPEFRALVDAIVAAKSLPAQTSL